MENCNKYMGYDVHQKPLSNIAQRILSAMQFAPSKRAPNDAESEQRKTICMLNTDFSSKKKYMEHDKIPPTVSGATSSYQRSKESSSTLKDAVPAVAQTKSYAVDKVLPIVSGVTSSHVRTRESSSTLRGAWPAVAQTKSHDIGKILSIVSGATLSHIRPKECSSTLRDAGPSVAQKKSHAVDKILPIVSGATLSHIQSKECSSTLRDAGPSVAQTRSHAADKTERLSSTKKDYTIQDTCGFVESRPSQIQVCDSRSLGHQEKSELLEEARQAEAVAINMVFQDGSSQLRPGKTPVSSVRGIVVLIKKQTCQDVQESRFIFIKIEQTSIWREQEELHEDFTRKMLLQILQNKGSVICFNAKDFLRTFLQIYSKDFTWKQVADFILFDPRIAAWLLDPNDTVPSFEMLVTKHCGKSLSVGTSNSNVDFENACENLETLHDLMKELQAKLQDQGLWQLFCTLELPVITILAVMETHNILVNKEELRKTSEFLGFRLKELEKEAHLAAGQKFRLTSSNELREVLFEKLHLHLLCTNKKLPKTDLRKLQSTSEYALNQLQDFHPLPKIILEYRQVHKIKSTFVDGLQSCMNKGKVSSTWNQTGTVSGRLSAKHPNIQGVPKLPVQIIKHQYVQGKEHELVSISPRALFVSSKDCTFLAADFSQIELRILAHFSSDPELLALFNEPETTDVFTTLASQWKGIPWEEVRQAEREQAKRVVYSVVYGAGKERLAECLRVTPVQAGQFIESFLQKYRLVHEFTQKTIQQCYNKGCVVSIMGRKRHLPQINASNYSLRTQAERQAVNFVIQGSAADLCKMAMIRIFTAIVTSPTLTARLIAQIHDELLFEVDDCQIQELSALVKSTMESLQHVEVLGVHMKVPLRVSLTVGKSWGCMAELR